MRLRYFLILIFFVLALIPVALFRAWPTTAVFETEMSEVHERHLLLARNLAAALERYHRDVTNMFELMISTPEVWASSTGVAGTLNNLGFRHVCVADPASGRVLYAIAVPDTPCPHIVPAEALEQFKAAATSSIAFTEVSQALDGENVLHVLTLLPEGQIAIGSLRTTYFIELGQAISFGKRGHAAIIDQAGNVLFHPLPDWTAARKNIAGVSAVQRMMKGETGVEVFYSPALKGDMIAGFTSVRPVGWGVMIPQPLAELHAKANFARNAAALVLVLGLVGAFVLALLISVFSSRPLEEISAAARRIAAGDLYDPSEIKTPRFLPRELRELHNSFRDMISRLRESMAQINTLAFVDSLTRLANREAFRRRLVAQIDKAGVGDHGTLLFLDLDGFKAINDTIGHDAGDAVLVEVASRLCRLLGMPYKKDPSEQDMLSPIIELTKPIAARLGGDEFAVYLPNQTSKEATDFASRVLRSLSLPIVVGIQKTRVGASIGMACFPEHGKTFSDLLKAADLAMYEAKRAGKNQTRQYTSDLTKSHDALSQLASELAEGFTKGQFDLHFQPVYDAQAFTVKSVEALIRWHHPTLGLLEADHFLETAARFGFQRQIDLFTLERSLEGACKVVSQGAKLPALSINIWTDSLLDQRFVDRVIKVLPRFPCQLFFELITVNTPLDARFVWAVDRLREAGVGIELGDFGTGATSVAALADFHPSVIKIGGKLVARVRRGEDGSKLVASLIDMAHAQDVLVTAEGVETLGQLNALRRMGCDYLQGTALNCPMTRQELFVCLTAAPSDRATPVTNQAGTM